MPKIRVIHKVIHIFHNFAQGKGLKREFSTGNEFMGKVGRAEGYKRFTIILQKVTKIFLHPFGGAFFIDGTFWHKVSLIIKV